MPLSTFRAVYGSGTGWADTPRLAAVPADAATIAAAAAAEAEVEEMPAGAVMVHVFAASRSVEYRDMAAAIIGGSGMLAKEMRFAGAIVSTGKAVMGWALPMGGGKYCAARERLEPKPPALSFVAAAAAADAGCGGGGGDALRVGAAGLTATRERLFGAGRGEATDNFDGAHSPASMLITGGLGALGTVVTLWAASKAPAATIHLLGRSGRSSSPLFAQLGGLDGSAAAGAAAASVACVTTTRCDTSSADEAGQVVARLARSIDHPSLSSAMHAAGTLRDAMVGKHFAGSVRDVAGSKVGSLARIEAAGLPSAAGQPLGSMVLFSPSPLSWGRPDRSTTPVGLGQILLDTLSIMRCVECHRMTSYDVARRYPSSPAPRRQRGAGRLGGAASGGGCQREQRAVGGVGRRRHGGGRRAVTPHAHGHGCAGAGGGLARAGRHYVRPTGTGRTWSRHDRKSLPLVRAVKLNSETQLNSSPRRGVLTATQCTRVRPRHPLHSVPVIATSSATWLTGACHVTHHMLNPRSSS